MSFDLFGPTKKRDVRVGYISTDRGYVKGITILEANKYAFKNPGTVFILQTRDSTRYLNINDVNKLTEKDILPSNTSGEGTCSGIVGLDPKVISADTPPPGPGTNNGDPRSFLPRGPVNPTNPGGPGDGTPTSPSTGSQPSGSKNPEQQTVGDGSPIVVISGSGGVGAKAIPVIGNDGSVLDIKLIYGGFGYKSPPKVSVIDPNRRGSGVVASSTIGVTTGPTLLTYTDEDDFEEYDFDPANGNPDLSGYGTRVGVDGENLGDWDPNLYASLEKDPIGIEIARYQQYLKELKNPWWSTRKELPLSVAFGDKKDRVVHQVVHHAWDDDPQPQPASPSSTPAGPSTGPNTKYEEVEFLVYTQGGNQEDRGMAFKFVSEDGSHKFQFKAVNYKDNAKTKVKKRVKINTKYKVTAVGTYKGKGVEQGLAASFGRSPKEIKGSKKNGTTIFADFTASANDNDDFQIRSTVGRFSATNERKFEGHTTQDLEYEYKVKKQPAPKKEVPTRGVDKKIKESFMNSYAISPVPMSDVPGSDFAGRWCTFEWEEDFPYSGEYVFRGMADNIGRIYLDNDRIMEVSHFRGNPLPSNIVKKTVESGVHKIKVELFNAPIKETVVTNNTKDQKEKVPVKFEVYGQGTIPNTAINMVFTSEDGSHSFTFKPEEGRGNTYDYDRTVRVLPNTQYKVQAVATGKFEARKQEFPINFDGLNRSNNPIEVSGKNSTNQNDTLKLRDGRGGDANAKFTIISTSPGVSAKFSDDGKKLLTKGTGDVTIRLRWDDNPRTAGVAVKRITIGGKTWKQTGEKGEHIQSISTTKGSVNLVPEQGTLKRDGFKKSRKRGAKESKIRSNVIFADIIGSANDNDDMQIRCSEGIFVPTNKRTGVQGTSGQGTQKRNTWDLTFRVNAKPGLKPGGDSGTNVSEIFNTTSYINKADRKLWRTNLYNNASFLNEYGVCPFNTITKKNEDYAGTHVIRWEHITFPADGNYQIEVEVDDRVKLFIGNRSGAGAMEIGNGLKNIEDGGDEVIIEKNGFIGNSNRGTGKSTYSKFFKKGQYRIRAELYQKPGGDFGFSGNKSYGQSDGSNLTARFEGSGNNIFMVMDGTGSATVNLTLKMDDNPRIKGHSAGSVRIGSVELKRSRGAGNKKYKEKELITGSGTFTGGERYRVVVSGASGGAGTPRVNRDTIELLDAGGDDTNGTIRIGKLRDRQGAPVKGLNPMSLAIRIRADVIETTRISPRTWNQNPMGSAFTIDAPLPPIPISPKPIGEGRCPDNPTWTTRFSGGSETWWPVTHKFRDGSRSWSKFMNRFAISPIPPLATESTDGGGIVYSNTWQINIPHSGFYALKGTVDNGGRILVDGTERIRGGYFQGAVFSEPAEDGSVGKLSGFRTVSPPLHKFYLEEGQHSITVEVENQKTTKQRKVEKKIFSTRDWRTNKTTADRVPVNFDVYGQGSKSNKQINFVFTSEDGKDSFTFKPKETKGNYNYSRQVKVLPGMNYKVQATASGSIMKNTDEEKIFPIRTEGANRIATRRLKNNKTIEFDDNGPPASRFDVNATLKIESTSPGVTARFSDDAKKLIVKGNGDVSLKFSWDDNPRTQGLAVGTLLVGSGDKVSWRSRQRGEKGSDTKTISVGGKEKTSLVPEQGTLKRGSFGKSKDKGAKESSNVSDVIFADIIGSANDNDDMQIRASAGEFTPSNKRKGVEGTSGQGTQKRNTWDLTFKVEGEKNPSAKTERGGVTYGGPQLFVIKSGSAVKVWSKFMQTHAVSPFIPPINQDNSAIVGSRTFVWKNINFFESGRYKFLFQADDRSTLFINGNQVAQARSFVGEPVPTYAEISAGKYDIKIVCENVNLARNILAQNNPTGFALKIMKDVVISEKSYSWTTNPVGISAMLIPPPCPKVVQGRGVVTDIIVRDPGNGMPPPTQEGVPTIITVKDIEPTLPGINYDPDDPAIINGIPTSIEVDNFGRVTKINVPTIIVTTTPVVEIPSLTGVGFRGTPIMQTTIVPEEVFDPEDLIQVTDLVGLKQTGFVNGKPYYGSVFSKDGQLFAGVYETTGDLIPVYATLQESIDQRVTTRPSAILRQGTDVSSNDPRLNIPGTPENLI